MSEIPRKAGKRPLHRPHSRPCLPLL